MSICRFVFLAAIALEKRKSWERITWFSFCNHGYVFIDPSCDYYSLTVNIWLISWRNKKPSYHFFERFEGLFLTRHV